MKRQSFNQYGLLAFCFSVMLLLGGCSADGYGTFDIQQLDEDERVTTDSYGCVYQLNESCLKSHAEWSNSANREISVTYFNHCPLRIVARVCHGRKYDGDDCQMINLPRGGKKLISTPQADGKYAVKYFGSESEENDKLCELRAPGLIF